ncbi:LPXTG cell wall anchor domain-containing protein [Kitasatospora sp. NPDC059571]|uniref:LPXTG cell wall anchor domain-containing protein n=1 Tax=Kitasatospora sp. NPDC059571 TaxID=3346871 RepID=UPI00369D77CD
MQFHLPTARGIAGAGALAAAMPFLLAIPAHAAAAAQQCPPAGVQHSLDGGKTWTTTFTVQGPAPSVIAVRLTSPPPAGCHYAVSLASYSTEGPTWSTSGTQKFLGWATTLIDQQNPVAKLDIGAYKPTCFGQIDLYGGNRKFDGAQAPLPRYPDSAVPSNMIAAWNGGTACATPSPSPTNPAPKPTPSPSTHSPAPTPSHSNSPTPAPEPSRSAAPVPPVSSAPPGTPMASPPSLAQTGSSGTGLIAGLSAVILAIGCGVLYLTRRSRNRRH